MKHTTKTKLYDIPTARKIRRDCSKELYRAIKRMDIYVSQDKIEQAERYYAQMVATHYLHLRELNQRKKQVEWWEEHCSTKLAELLEVDQQLFIQAFKRAYLSS